MAPSSSSRPPLRGRTARSDVPRRSRPPSRASTGISTSTTTKRTGGPISRRQGRRFGNRPAGGASPFLAAPAPQGAFLGVGAFFKKIGGGGGLSGGERADRPPRPQGGRDL